MIPDVISHDTSAHLYDISVEHRGVVGKATALSTAGYCWQGDSSIDYI